MPARGDAPRVRKQDEPASFLTKNLSVGGSPLAPLRAAADESGGGDRSFLPPISGSGSSHKSMLKHPSSGALTAKPARALEHDALLIDNAPRSVSADVPSSFKKHGLASVGGGHYRPNHSKSARAPRRLAPVGKHASIDEGREASGSPPPPGAEEPAAGRGRRAGDQLRGAGGADLAGPLPSDLEAKRASMPHFLRRNPPAPPASLGPRPSPPPPAPPRPGRLPAGFGQHRRKSARAAAEAATAAATPRDPAQARPAAAPAAETPSTPPSAGAGAGAEEKESPTIAVQGPSIRFGANTAVAPPPEAEASWMSTESMERRERDSESGDRAAFRQSGRSSEGARSTLAPPGPGTAGNPWKRAIRQAIETGRIAREDVDPEDLLLEISGKMASFVQRVLHKHAAFLPVLSRLRRQNLLEERTQAPLIAFEDLHLKRRLGRGRFAEAILASWMGREVVVKKYFESGVAVEGERSEEDLEMLRKETGIMSKLAHPNVVRCLGICLEPRHLSVVVEYCAKGSLGRYVRNAANEIDYGFCVRTATGIARGMAYLHGLEPAVVHRDLKGDNIFLAEDLTPRIGDFGLSIDKDNTKTMTECGTFQFVAPEVLRADPASELVDVYGFSMVVYEMVFRRTPHAEADILPMLIALRAAFERLRPTLEACPWPDFAELMEECWADDPNRRPSFAMVVERLEAFPPEPRLPGQPLAPEFAAMLARHAEEMAARPEREPSPPASGDDLAAARGGAVARPSSATGRPPRPPSPSRFRLRASRRPPRWPRRAPPAAATIAPAPLVADAPRAAAPPQEAAPEAEAAEAAADAAEATEAADEAGGAGDGGAAATDGEQEAGDAPAADAAAEGEPPPEPADEPPAAGEQAEAEQVEAERVEEAPAEAALAEDAAEEAAAAAEGLEGEPPGTAGMEEAVRAAAAAAAEEGDEVMVGNVSGDFGQAEAGAAGDPEPGPGEGAVIPLEEDSGLADAPFGIADDSPEAALLAPFRRNGAVRLRDPLFMENVVAGRDWRVAPADELFAALDAAARRYYEAYEAAPAARDEFDAALALARGGEARGGEPDPADMPFGIADESPEAALLAPFRRDGAVHLRDPLFMENTVKRLDWRVAPADELFAALDAAAQRYYEAYEAAPAARDEFETALALARGGEAKLASSE
eukprot:tig00001024_g6337.t1